MAKPTRLTRRQGWLLVCIAGGWMPIMYGRDDQRITDALLRLELVTGAGYPAAKGCAWSVKPAPLGRALGCLLGRRTGAKLKRAGVEVLAKYRAELLRRFDVDGSVANLVAEQGHLLELKAKRERVQKRKAAARG